MKGKLYLIPSFLGNEDQNLIPIHNKNIIYSIVDFVAEREKTARAFLKKIEHPLPQSEFSFEILNKHTSAGEIPEFLEPCKNGKDMGLLSEAGLPCVADPGAMVVNAARKKGIEIVPLTGLSSIMMSLMASGMNGQQFRFHGYLPIDLKQKVNKIKEISKSAIRNETQIFIETPYRNEMMLKDLIKFVSPQLRICIAMDLSLETEEIHCKTLMEWHSTNLPKMHKRPCVFLVGV